MALKVSHRLRRWFRQRTIDHRVSRFHVALAVRECDCCAAVASPLHNSATPNAIHLSHFHADLRIVCVHALTDGAESLETKIVADEVWARLASHFSCTSEIGRQLARTNQGHWTINPTARSFGVKLIRWTHALRTLCAACWRARPTWNAAADGDCLPILIRRLRMAQCAPCAGWCASTCRKNGGRGALKQTGPRSHLFGPNKSLVNTPSSCIGPICARDLYP